jgi:hypothetical protein
MDFHQDFAGLCSLLNVKAVDFLIVGGYTVAFHGSPRFTGDLDILVAPVEEQVSRMLEALREFGFPTHQLSPEYVVGQRIFAIGTPAGTDTRND